MTKRDIYRPNPASFQNVKLRTYADLPGAEVYTFQRGDELLAKVFGGRRSKPDFFFRFPSTERREQRIAQWLEGQREAIKRRLQRSVERAAPHNFKPGQLFYISWGYDQTNVDYYMLTELRGKTQGYIVPIGSKTVRTATGADYVSPNPSCRLDYDTLLNGSGGWKRLRTDGWSIDGRYFARPCDADTEKYQTAAGYGH